jgi:PAS domain S-box-containing protein
MTKSASLQSRIAKLRLLLLDVLKTLNRSMPDVLVPKGNYLKTPVTKDKDLQQKLDDLVKEFETVRGWVNRFQTLSLLRIEMWKAAVGNKTSEKNLIEKLLFLVGPALNLSRCSYFDLNKDGSDALCTIQWHKSTVCTTLSETLPNTVVREFIRQRYVVICEGVSAGKKQSEIAGLLKLLKVKSFLAVPYEEKGMLTFSDCDSVRKWTLAEIDLLIEIAHIVSARSAQLKAEQMLSNHNIRLEQQVKVRTADLAAANLKLKAEKGLLTVTLRSIGEAVITLDAEGTIVLFNKAAEFMTGWTIEEAAGKKFEIVVQIFNEDHSTVRYDDFIARCLDASRQKSENSCILRSRSGKNIITAYQGAQIKEKDEYAGVVVVLRDITQSRFLEEELIKIKKFESVGVLAGGVAHDFNNLLTGITTYLFMAKTSASDNKETCSMITEAEKAAFKATSLTKQLLSFAKGGPSLMETVSVKQLIRDTVGFCLSGSNVDYRIDISEDLWPAKVDRGQIDQVLNNLLLNAVQAMPGGGTVMIKGENYLRDTTGFTADSPKAASLALGKYIMISVIDEGVGISYEQLSRIFDPYFTTKKGGAGLGLTTAYSIIKRHGGLLYAESILGKGSVFTFYLPASDKPENKNKSNGSPVSSGTGKILIMDDDMIVRTVVETLLKKAGYSPIGVSNSTQTLEIYAEALSQKEPFIVTIMDLTIPGGMGGKETVRKLREIDPHAKVIAFSGYSNDPIFTDYKKYGFDGVLAKPFSIQEFMRTIALVLQVPQNDENAQTLFSPQG